jgi:ubiquinone/menaquinone biosynthesis C-methylase UbiE
LLTFDIQAKIFAMAKNWDSSEKWYTSCVGEKGHYYHQTIVIPNALRLLGTYHSLLDLGCGQGVLARHIPDSIEYVGIDLSKELIHSAKRLTQQRQFLVADATLELPLKKKDFDRVCMILSLQNMQEGKGAIQNAQRHLKKGGKLLIVMNHPCFRIPRQSSWGVDEKMNLQYRRIDTYMSNQEIPIQTNPGKGNQSETTFSYHHPLSVYAGWLREAKLSIETMEEWCSDKKSEGAKAKMENRARREIPLFLAIVAVKERE